MEKTYVALDLETTGLYPERGHRVIEIGAVRLENGRPANEFHCLVNPGIPVPKAARRIHGITEEMLQHAPGPKEAFRAFSVFLGGSVLLMHNARFDLGFLRAELRRLNMNLENRHLCTYDLSKLACPGLPNHRLGTVHKHLLGGRPVSSAQHRALVDARSTAEVYLALCQRGVTHAEG